MICNLVYVKATILNFRFFQIEKINFVKRFNNSNDDLIILIIMHVVFIQDVNFDSCCNKMIIIINATNTSQRWQNWKKLFEYICQGIGSMD